MSTKLWFFDLKFARFVTPQLVGFLWFLYLVILVAAFGYSVFNALQMPNLLLSIAAIGAAAILSAFALLVARIALEALLVAFRITDRLEPLVHLVHLAQLSELGADRTSALGAATLRQPGTDSTSSASTRQPAGEPERVSRSKRSSSSTRSGNGNV